MYYASSEVAHERNIVIFTWIPLNHYALLWSTLTTSRHLAKKNAKSGEKERRRESPTFYTFFYEEMHILKKEFQNIFTNCSFVWFGCNVYIELQFTLRTQFMLFCIHEKTFHSAKVMEPLCQHVLYYHHRKV